MRLPSLSHIILQAILTSSATQVLLSSLLLKASIETLRLLMFAHF